MLESLKAKAAAVILSLPRAWFPEDQQPETDAQYEARIVRTTSVIVDEAATHAKRVPLNVDEMTALGLAISYNESAFAWEVHAGKPWPKRPPPFGDNGHAACVFQLQPSAAMVPLDQWRPFERGEWSSLVGLDPESTRRCARAGMRAIAWHTFRCARELKRHREVGDHTWVGTIIASQYHRPSSTCGRISTGSFKRGRLYRSILTRFRSRS